jgi:hypothetical protein
MFGCMTTIAIGNNPDLQKSVATETSMYFSTVQRSILTLIQIMTMDNWSDITRAYWVESPLSSVFLVFYMVCSAIILMNMVSAVFVDNLVPLTSPLQTIADCTENISTQI